MLTGPRADEFEYQQVAYSEFTPSTTSFVTPANGLIDCIKLGLPVSFNQATGMGAHLCPSKESGRAFLRPGPRSQRHRLLGI